MGEQTVVSSRWRSFAAALTLALISVIVPHAPAAAQQAGIAITELYYNPDGPEEGHEFIEVTNSGARAVDISGWAFTSGVELLIPDGTVVASGARLVFGRDAIAFASVFGFVPAGDYSGSLNNGGETLTLRDPADVIMDQVTWDDASPWPSTPDGDDDSLQLLDDTSQNAVVDNDNALSWGAGLPTPGAANSVRLDVIVDVGRGWYSNSQTVRLTATIPGSEILYSTGTGTPSTAYSGPITINDNGAIRVLRVKARSGGAESPVSSHTYVFKPDQGVPVVATWPNPVPVAPGQSEDRVTFEFIPPPSTGLLPVFGWSGVKASAGGVDAGESDKFFFRGSYGNGTLDGDLFGDLEFRVAPAREFDQLFLRDRHLDGTHLRQMIAHDAALALGSLAPHGRFVEYYVNGSDQGVRHLQERPEGGFMEAYTGIDKDEWLAWSRNEGALTAQTMGAPFGSWAEVVREVNVEQFIDSQLVQWQANVEDYRGPKNFRTAGPVNASQGDGGGYRYHFFNWDMDIGYASNFYGRGAPNLWAWADFVSPGYLAHEMDNFDEFAFLFSDRVACAHYGAGALTAGAFRTRLDARVDELRRAGGANQSSFASSLGSWLAQRNSWLLDRYASDSGGTRTVYNSQRSDTWPNKPPSNFIGPLTSEFAPVGVTVSNGRLSLSSAGGGELWYRIDGGDPRTANGAVDPAAVRWTAPVELPTGRHEVIARSYHPAESNVRNRWSLGCNEPVVFNIAGVADSVVITELHYNPLPSEGAEPVDGDRFEFIEIFNPGQQPVGLGGFGFALGVDYEFPVGTTIAAGERLVLASDAAQFNSRFGQLPDDEYSGNLSDSGETIEFADSLGRLVDAVTWTDDDPWPIAPDFGGPSLSLISPERDNSLAQSWRPSTAVDGTPGEPNVTLALGDVDGSGTVDTGDVQAMLAHLAGLTPDPFEPVVADINNDGTLTLLDALLLAQQIA